MRDGMVEFDIEERLEPPGKLSPFLSQIVMLYVFAFIIQFIFSVVGFNEGEAEFLTRIYEIAEPIIILPAGYMLGCLGYKFVRRFRSTAPWVVCWFILLLVIGTAVEMADTPSALISDSVGLFRWPRWQTDGFVVVYLYTYPALLCAGYSWAALNISRRTRQIKPTKE